MSSNENMTSKQQNPHSNRGLKADNAKCSEFKKLGDLESRFRNNNIDCLLILLLPAITLVQFIFAKDQIDSSLSACLLLTTTIPPVLVYRFGIGHYIIPIVNGIIHTLLTNNLPLNFSFTHFPIFVLNCLLVVYLKVLPSTITKCFTFLELTIVLQCHNYLSFVLLTFGFQSAPLHDVNAVLLTCFLALYIALFSLCIIKHEKLKTLWFICVIPVLTYVILYCAFNIEIVSWLANFIFNSQQRILLFCSWFVILFVSCVFAFLFSIFSTSHANTCTRKIFHLALTFIYVCGLYFDRDFLDFSSKVVFIALVYIEILRAYNVEPIGAIIESVVSSFRDEKDSGILQISHIHLFCGCLSSLWLSRDIHSTSIFLLTAGVVSVGIGDTFASICGYLIGSHRWPDSKKTYEGTFCSLLAQQAVLYAIHISFLEENFTLISFAFISLISTFSALIETHIVSHFDNLVLPPLQYLFVLLLTRGGNVLWV